MKSITTHEKTLHMVQLAFLAAIEVVLTLLYIPVGTINLNFGLTPIIIAAVLMGPVKGAVIGAVSGIVTMFQVISGQGVFYMFLMAENPIAACFLCVIKTAAAGFICGIVFKAIDKILKHRTITSVISSAVCPLVNTGLFAIGMILIFGKALMANPEISAWANGGGLVVLVFVVLIGVNFFVELLLNAVICPLIIKALRSAKLFKTMNTQT